MPIIAQGVPGTLDAVLGAVDWDVSPAPTVTVQTLAGVEQAGFPATGLIHDGLGEYHYDWSVPAGQGIDTYDVHFAGYVGGAPYDGWDTVEVVAAGTTSWTTLAQVKALVKSRLSDGDLQTIIDREEAWLAGRVGVLGGERTDTFNPGIANVPLYIQRRADSVVVTDNGAAVDAANLLFTPSTGCLRRILGTVPLAYAYAQPWYPCWSGAVTVTYTPTDGADVTRAVIELVRLTTSETGFDSEQIGDYSYSRGASAGRVSRAGVVRSILLRRPAYSLSLRSTAEARP